MSDRETFALWFQAVLCKFTPHELVQTKCFGNTEEGYGHANKASFEFEFERVSERARERVKLTW